MKRPLILFTTFFIAQDQARQQELNTCLLRNLKNSSLSQVIIFIQSEAERKEIESLVAQADCKAAEFILQDRIPTYQDWLKAAADRFQEADVIFANADIYFDESVLNLPRYLQSSDRIVCLSRHDQDETGKVRIHPNPHWSQDAWAIRSEEIKKIRFIEELEFSTGKPRCDNRLAFVFSVWGWNLYNPCHEVKAIHLHNSKMRSYRYEDLVNVGAVAYVYPCPNPEQPSLVDFSIFILKSTAIRKVAINDFLERKRKALS